MSKIIVIVLAGVLSACAQIQYEADVLMHGRVTSTQNVLFEDQSYQVSFIPYGSYVNETPEGELLSVGTGVGPIPRYEVVRVDGGHFVRGDIETARQVVMIACEKRPGWRRTPSRNPGLEFKVDRISFMELCSK